MEDSYSVFILSLASLRTALNPLRKKSGLAIIFLFCSFLEGAGEASVLVELSLEEKILEEAGWAGKKAVVRAKDSRREI